MKKLLFLFPIIFLGCFNKPEPEIVFVKSKCAVPTLYIFRNDTNYSLTYKVINNKVCIKEWETCIPRNEFFKLINTLQKRNKIIKKYENEITIYQKFKKLNEKLEENVSKNK